MKKEAVKNIEPVVKKELDAITIGTLKETTKKTPIGALILIVILVAFAFMLPEINTWLKKQNTQVIGGSITPKVEPQEKEKETEDKLYYPISSTSTIKVNDLTFNEFNLSVQTLSFTITNSGKLFNFNDQKMYVEVYDQNKKLLERRVINQITTLKTGSKKTDVIFNNDMTKAAYISIHHIDEDSYPAVSINNNQLICTQGSNKLTYTFTKDELSNIAHEITINKNTKSYTTNLGTNRNQLAKYKSINGVTVNEKDEVEAFIFTVTIDTTKLTDILDNDLYFANKTKLAVINFELETSGYNCN